MEQEEEEEGVYLKICIIIILNLGFWILLLKYV